MRPKTHRVGGSPGKELDKEGNSHLGRGSTIYTGYFTQPEAERNGA